MSYRMNNYFETFHIFGNISNRSKTESSLNNFSTYEQVNKHLIVLYVYYTDLSEEPKNEKLFILVSNMGGILDLSRHFISKFC